MMIQQTTFLLRSIWENSSWRDDLLAAFMNWVQEDASRNDVKDKLQALMRVDLTRQAESRFCDVNLEQVNWDQLTEFLCTCFYRKRLRRSLPDIPSDEIWMKLSNEQNQGPLSLHPQQNIAIQKTVPVPLFPLEQKLLKQGGQRMVYREEPDLKMLLKRGEAFDDSAELVPGEPHFCHSNVAQL